VSVLAILVTIVLFVVPLLFIVLTAGKTATDAATMSFSWPHEFRFVENFKEVIQANNYLLVIAFINSTILTVVSVTGMVIFGAMVAFVAQRRKNAVSGLVNFLVLAGLIIPPAVVPTVWALQKYHLFGTMSGLILVEIAYGLPFSILLFRAFIGNIPRDLDEAAILDGASPFRLFFRVIFPLLRPVAVTVIIFQTVIVFNDFANPLYFLPGEKNATVQLTIFTFKSQFVTSYNLLFMDILLITIPPLIVFIILNRQIVAGMTSGAVKG
jgi:raffinose/stachyose/melibiose transport system permease protein